MKERILHITPWYPNRENPTEAIWIQRHIEALSSHFEQDILHLEVKSGPFKYNHQEESNLRRVILHVPISSWRVKEILGTFLLLIMMAFYHPPRKYKLWNFHIAYPHLVYLGRWHKLFKTPFVITEHWSFYHFRFFSDKKLTRIKRIFHRGIPLITVSEQLSKDISTFSGKEQGAMIIPNVVDCSLFQNSGQERKEHFLMTAFWKSPKKPLSVIHALAKLKAEGKVFHLHIGGYGPLLPAMREAVEELDLKDQVLFLGKLRPEEFALELNDCRVFLLPSEYETFSVVCTEAICCGCPVYASDAGALPELITGQNGLLVDNGRWEEALLHEQDYNYRMIAEKARSKYEKERVGNLYSDYLKSLM